VLKGIRAGLIEVVKPGPTRPLDSRLRVGPCPTDPHTHWAAAEDASRRLIIRTAAGFRQRNLKAYCLRALVAASNHPD